MCGVSDKEWQSMGLDKKIPIPKHFQLREAIKRDTLRNGLKAGDAIPSERELAQTYEVSRVTVRRAISDLVREGFLRREDRRGTFVADASRAVLWLPNTKRRLIGVLLCRIANFFSERLLRGVDDTTHELNYNVAFGSSDEDPLRAAQQIERMADEGVVGFIIVPLAGENYRQINEQLFEQIRAKGLPFVLLDCYVEGSGVDTVVSDNFDGAYRATQHLVDLGHHRIVFLAYLPTSAVEERIAGYQKCLRDNGICPNENLIKRVRPEQVKQVVKEMLTADPKITAIFAVNDAKAMLAWEALREMGLRVPENVALVGYDNMYGSSGPGALLTTTDQPLYEEGKLACKLLIERINGYDGEPRFAVLKSTLIQGHSTVAEIVVKAGEENGEIAKAVALETQRAEGSAA